MNRPLVLDLADVANRKGGLSSSSHHFPEHQEGQLSLLRASLLRSPGTPVSGQPLININNISK